MSNARWNLAALAAAIAAAALLLTSKRERQIPMVPSETAASKRNRVIAYAATQLHETDPSLYWQDVLGSVPAKSIAWCGAFVLWVLRATLAVPWRWVIGKGFLYVDDYGNDLRLPRLPIVKTPSIGDIAYFDKPYQHYALVESVESGQVHLIAGNTPDVDRSVVPIERATAYFSIAPLL